MTNDRISDIRARCAEATKALREQLPPQKDYAEMVGAPAWAYGKQFVWDDPAPYAMDDAANLLGELLAELDRLTEALRKAGEMRPYKQIGNHESYSQYNEGWQDAVSYIEAALPAAIEKGAEK